MKNILIVVALLLGLTGCEGKPRVYESTIPKEYKILGINQPKHFYIDIEDVETGQVFKQVYISKHCNAWRKLKLGSVWTFQEQIYTDSDKVRRIRVEVGNFCDTIRNIPE